MDLIPFPSPLEPFFRWLIGTALQIIADFLGLCPTFEIRLEFSHRLSLERRQPQRENNLEGGEHIKSKERHFLYLVTINLWCDS